jgi:hypothetical protein
MLILLTPPGLFGAVTFGYFEMNWHRIRKECELDELKFEERINTLETKLDQYDWKSRDRK